MDSLQMNEFQAINRYRKQRILNKIMLYSFTSLTCILFLSSPLWYPLLRAFVKSLPKLGALFFSSKCIFLVGNLIVIFLVGESKMFKSTSSSSSSSLPSHVDEKHFIFLAGESKISRSKYFSSLPYEDDDEEVDKESGILENLMDGIKGNYCMSNEELLKFKFDIAEAEPNELSKRADDFIARVNKQIRLEAVCINDFGVS